MHPPTTTDKVICRSSSPRWLPRSKNSSNAHAGGFKYKRRI
jgi:hypothetical protein